MYVSDLQTTMSRVYWSIKKQLTFISKMVTAIYKLLLFSNLTKPIRQSTSFSVIIITDEHSTENSTFENQLRHFMSSLTVAIFSLSFLNKRSVMKFGMEASLLHILTGPRLNTLWPTIITTYPCSLKCKVILSIKPNLSNLL